MFFEPWNFHPFRNPLLRILTESKQHYIDPAPVKIELSSRRNACFQKVRVFVQNFAAQKNHKQTSQNGYPKSTKIGSFFVPPIDRISFFLKKKRILTLTAVGDPFGPLRGSIWAPKWPKMWSRNRWHRENTVFLKGRTWKSEKHHRYRTAIYSIFAMSS